MKLLDHLKQGQLSEIERIIKVDQPIVKEKEIIVRLTIKTSMSHYQACELVEQALMNSSLNNSEFALVVKETKVESER